MNQKARRYTPASQEMWEEQFHRRISQPKSWLLSAFSLKQSADILWPDIKSFYDNAILTGEINDSTPPPTSSWMLLLGYAIENLLKGLCIINNGAFKPNGHFKYISHNLLNLCEIAGLDLTEEESFIIEKLEQSISWAGKYPAPLRYTDLMPRVLHNGGISTLDVIVVSSVSSKSDLNKISNIYDKFHKELEEKI